MEKQNKKREVLGFQIIKADDRYKPVTMGNGKFWNCKKKNGEIVDFATFEAAKKYCLPHDVKFIICEKPEICRSKKHKTIYLSGKISGEDKQKCWEKFAKAEDDMRAKGFNVINPLEIRTPTCPIWENFMLRDLRELSRNCDCLYAMADWQESMGASIEVAFAIGTGRIDILYEI